MATETDKRARVREAAVALRGLRLTRVQLAIELARPWALFGVYVGLSIAGLHWLAAPVAAVTCFAAFVQMHDAIHESLGLTKRGHDVVLALSAQLILKSGHALKATHLRHHGKCLGEEDPEGAPAHWSLGRVLFAGPFHILAMRRDALRIAPRTRALQLVETCGTVVLLGLAVLLFALTGSPAGLIYWGVAAVVSAAMPLWAAYIPHRLADTSPPVRAAARFARLWTPIVSSFAYHHVHHTHPKVPTALLHLAAGVVGPEDLVVHVHREPPVS